MATLDVYNVNREKISQVEVVDSVFAAEVKQHLFYDVIRMQLNRRRAGTSSTKTRAEVSGGGKKPWKQKGTGRARSGSSRSPVWRGGGIAFGPRPRSYDIKVPKKVRRAAMCSALSLKVQQEKLLVLDTLEMPEIKTAAFVAMLEKLQAGSALIIADADHNLLLSSRNVPHVKVLPPEGLNLYDVLKYDELVITQTSLKSIERSLAA
ncbi:MAG: 50S ribosomal protein L4 [Deltaproteobacteria bacterium]|jgi:large subunit ribosomal protein L4|nr:50S ribosomal protein L4 [Deltaproteobacteria bacterium]